MSQSDDPFATSLSEPSQPAPPPTKRLLFKNRQRHVPKPEPEVDAAEAVDFFSRSKEIFPAALEEQRERDERRRKRKEKEKQKENVKIEKGAVAAGSDDEYVEQRTAKRHKSTDSTPPKTRRRSGSVKTSPKYTSPFHQRQAKDLQEIIALDDSDEDIIAPSNEHSRTTSGTQKPNRRYGGFVSDSSPEPEPLAKFRRSPSLELLEPELEIQEDEMFPELVAEARAKEAAARAQHLADMQTKMRRNPAQPTSDTGSNSPFSRPSGLGEAAASSPTIEKINQDPIISILVTSHLPGTKPLLVKRKLSQRFKDVRMAWCDVQSISDTNPPRHMTDEEKASIFLTWRGRRIWDSGTGMSIGVKVGRNGRVVDENGEFLGDGQEGQVCLEAWNQEWFDNAKAEAKRASALASGEGADKVEISDDEDEEARAEAEKEKAQVIKVVLKAKDTEEVKLKVKPSTTISKLVGAWRSQRAEAAEGKEVELWFEGDRLEEEGTVEEADIEDMCVVDVIVR